MTDKRKYGAYLSEEIVTRAKQVHPDGGENFSQLIEDSLRLYAETHERDRSPERQAASRMRNAPSGELAARYAGKFTEAVEALSAIGTERLEAGYELGLTIAAHLSLEEMFRCVRAGGQLTDLLAKEINGLWYWERSDIPDEYLGPPAVELLSQSSHRQLRSALDQRSDVWFGCYDDEGRDPGSTVPESLVSGIVRALLDVGAEVRRRLTLAEAEKIDARPISADQ
jgi:hypothetical protein